MSKGHGAGAKARRRMMKLRREGGVMSDKIQVPDGMSQAVHKAFIDASTQDEFVGVDSDALQMILEAALRWLSENPIVPTDAQIEDMKIKLVPVHPHWSNIVAEWQRRMFIAPDPEVDRVDLYTRTPDGEYRPWKPTEAQDEMCKSFDTAFGRFEIDDRVPPGEIRLHKWNGPTLLKVDAPEPEEEVVVIETKLGNRFRCTVKDGMIQSAQYYGHDPDAPQCGELWPRRIVEPEVPEEIKDLLLVDIREGFFKPEVINERMAECYRRGRKAGAK